LGQEEDEEETPASSLGRDWDHRCFFLGVLLDEGIDCFGVGVELIDPERDLESQSKFSVIINDLGYVHLVTPQRND
jgi:hypothetical protein